MDQVKQLFEVNFFGALRLIQAVLPGMKARESGYIVNVSSMAGELGGPFNDIYCASKFALGGLTESLAPVLRQFKIKLGSFPFFFFFFFFGFAMINFNFNQRAAQLDKVIIVI